MPNKNPGGGNKSSGGGNKSSGGGNKTAPSSPGSPQAQRSGGSSSPTRPTTSTAPSTSRSTGSSSPSSSSSKLDKKEVKQLVTKLAEKNKTPEQIEARVTKAGKQGGGVTAKGKAFLDRYTSKGSSPIPGQETIDFGTTSSASGVSVPGKTNDSTDSIDNTSVNSAGDNLDDRISPTEASYLGAGLDLVSARVRAQADIEVAKLQKEAYLGVAGIETKGKLDLQPIINAGLKDVETIRAQSERDVANISKAASMYGLIGAAFT